MPICSTLRSLSFTLALITATLLTACGGGSSTENLPQPSVAPTAHETNEPTVHVSGIASNGSALVNATITAKCAHGSDTTTTGANGHYALDIPQTSLPCLLQLTPAATPTATPTTATNAATTASYAHQLHSLVPPTTQSQQTAHITPFTELLLTHLTAYNPSVFIASASPASLIANITPSNVANAQAKLENSLKLMGVNPSTLHSPLSQPLVATSATQQGNAYNTLITTFIKSLANSGATLPLFVKFITDRARFL